jgi:cytidylate kinase
MLTDLLQYFDKRLSTEHSNRPSEAKPFITLSRETGCHSIHIGELLIRKLNNDQPKRPWRLISKEIIDLSAQKLSIATHEIEAMYGAEKRGHLLEIIRAFGSRDYKSDQTIRKEIRQFIRNIAQSGHIVIVGRAGAALTAGLPKGYHCRLFAPIDWRIDQVMQLKQLDHNHSKQYITETDRIRNQFFIDFSHKSIAQTTFDLHINNMTFTDEHIAEILYRMIQS